jgi:inositol-phosphate phosphatase / L-galactose 1-phosphate phosphatase / histidinol-phosphatase
VGQAVTLPTTYLDELTAFACDLADTSRAMLDEAVSASMQVEVKPDRSLVTQIDLAIEVRLREMIEARYPHHGIVGEEQGTAKIDADFVWVLDPIDGTAPFIAGIPVYGTLIALAHAAKPIIGVADLPVTRDRWVGCEGRPTRHGTRAVTTRPCSALADAMLSTSNPDFYAENERPALDSLRQKTRWRIYGGSAMSYGLLASGRIDVAIDTRLKIHDFACFRPIIEGAGGIISDWQGRPITLESGPQILAAGDAARHAESRLMIEHVLNK